MARFEKDKQQVPWVRLYEPPSFVFFSHQKHIDTKADCAVCHGVVRDQTILRQEKDISMASCVNWYQLRTAPSSCSLCHNLGYSTQ